jgi:hypothetical protein
VQGVTIDRVQQQTRFTGSGGTETIMRVTFRIGEHGPFTEDIPKAQFSQAEVEARARVIKTTLDALK